MPTSFSIPEIYEKEIEAVIRAGYYSNKSEVVREALRDFFEKKSQLRIAAALEMYKNREITLSRAAEIAGMNFFDFKELVIERGIKIIISKQSKDEMKRDSGIIRKSKKR